ncbi:ABC transporter permease [Desulfuromonas versatilis]|uniref:ABC transporter permease n=1 Tax=Desulfuromonas versatilis TaxID=2802975 RepID=A0ABM8HV54_9BACT|nr:FtsX-like permease family protein [Desulfuromonas versatilis]BCR05875.1 ABC transporter permease [Desulfuromonas versatilis]
MLLTLATRNIWRNKRRTLLTLSAMVVSSSLLMLSLGIFSGMLMDILASATEQYHGHVVVSRSGYQDERDMFLNIADEPQLLARLAASPGVVGASPRLRAFGLLSRGNNTYPAEILGIEPGRERQVTHLDHKLIAGSYLPDDAGRQVVIGRGLAEKLGATPGDEVVFVTQAADGSIGNDLLTVSGIFETGDAGHDNALVMAELAWLQEVMVLPGRLHEVALSVADPRLADAAAADLAARLPADFEVLDWGRLLPEMREVIASYDVSRMILVVILYSATGLGILNTFFMSVLERTREFGILMAMGMKPWKLRAMVLLETLVMGLLSLAAGITLGLLLTWYMQAVGIDLSGYLTPVTYAGGTILPRLSAVFEAKNIWVPALILLATCLLAGYLPARRAARLRPVEAIREN